MGSVEPRLRRAHGVQHHSVGVSGVCLGAARAGLDGRDEGQGGARGAASGCAAHAVRVGGGRLGKVKVDDEGDAHKVDAARYAVLLVAGAAFVFALGLGLGCGGAAGGFALAAVRGRGGFCLSTRVLLYLFLLLIVVVVVVALFLFLCPPIPLAPLLLVLLLVLVLVVVHLVFLAVVQAGVRGDEVVEEAAVELVQNVHPRVDGDVRVEHCGLDAKLLQKELEAVALVDVVDEHQALALQQAEAQKDVENEELVVFLGPQVKLHQVAAALLLLELEDGRVVQSHLFELLQLGRERGGHQEALEDFGHLEFDLVNVLGVAKGEHEVGLVDDHGAAARQVDGACANMLHKLGGRGDDNLWPALEAKGLHRRVVVGQRRHVHHVAAVVQQIRNVLLNLLAQLLGGHQDEALNARAAAAATCTSARAPTPAAAAPSRPLAPPGPGPAVDVALCQRCTLGHENLLQHWQGKRNRLARTRARAHHNVLAVQHQRDGPGLHQRGINVSKLRQSLDQAPVQPKVALHPALLFLGRFHRPRSRSPAPSLSATQAPASVPRASV